MKVITVDADQYDKMMTVKWYYNNVEGCAIKTTYPQMRVPQFLFGMPPLGYEWDHINQDKLDNRRENLRHATPSQNKANRGKFGGIHTSKYIGVCWNKKSEKWMAYIETNGKRTYLGLFTKQNDAAIRRNEAATEYHGEFAVLNIIDPEIEN